MSKKDANIIYRRLIRSYLSSVISISLVLFVVALVGLLVINVHTVSNYFKESIPISVIFKLETEENKALSVSKELEKLSYVNEVRYISKEDGIREMENLLGKGFLDLFESEPIPISLELQLKPQYYSTDSLKIIEKELVEIEEVSEILYQESLVDILNANLERVALVLGVFVLILMFVSIVLINNTVRLNVYSKRFTIHTMRLVGATKNFITTPFLVQAFFQGVISSSISVLGLLGVVFTIRKEFNQLFLLFDMDYLVYLVLAILLLGIAMCVISTNFVVRKVISLTKDELYY